MLAHGRTVGVKGSACDASNSISGWTHRRGFAEPAPVRMMRM
jgi:hypothetical protein